MSGYSLHLLALAGALAAGAIGWQIVFGLAGALSLAAGMAMGLGAYALIILPMSGWPFGLALAAAALGPTLIFAAFTGIIRRLESHYFALATLALAEIAVIIATNWETVTGGANGLLMMPGPAWLNSAEARVAFAWGAALAAAAAFYGFQQYFGREQLTLLRTEPLAARAFGIKAGQIRVAAMGMGALAGGLGGAAHAFTVGLVSPDVLSFKTMAAILAVVIIGGRRSPLAAMILALLVTWTPEWLRFLEQTYLIAYGILLLLVVWLAPEGLSALVARATRPLRRARGLKPPPLEALGPADKGGLAATGLVRRFGGVTAVANVSLALSPGEITALIGPNGAGKSTLLNLVTGLDQPSAGDIHLTGRIGRTFQTAALAPDLSALENVRATGASAKHAWAALHAVGLTADAGTPASHLAQGAQRFLEIARALAARPGVLLLDESAAGLSADERQHLAQVLRAAAGAGATVLIVEHDVPFLSALADHMICMSEGHVIASGDPNAVTRDPAVITAYLGAPLDRGTPA
jgi:branched-chain amino acid transport system permease protein